MLANVNVSKLVGNFVIKCQVLWGVILLNLQVTIWPAFVRNGSNTIAEHDCKTLNEFCLTGECLSELWYDL